MTYIFEILKHVFWGTEINYYVISFAFWFQVLHYEWLSLNEEQQHNLINSKLNNVINDILLM